eukprot:TRINITY_DN10932_c0_g2_i2.p1 TRINITY_DN10932_c0_g2~~TRINITY_DN10932_c0_g2_i2.p1  ORF type:complete len:134 (+),score=36.99 TRINITY_DN10932_c0_g2_i2:25-426(+)
MVYVLSLVLYFFSIELIIVAFFFFFFKQKTAYEMLRSLVGSEMCIRDRCIKGILLFSSLVLIGAGWSIVKSSINNQEATLLKLLIPAQILLNICQIVLDETSKGNRSWGIAQDVLLFLDMVCCLAVLLPSSPP